MAGAAGEVALPVQREMFRRESRRTKAGGMTELHRSGVTRGAEHFLAVREQVRVPGLYLVPSQVAISAFASRRVVCRRAGNGKGGDGSQDQSAQRDSLGYPKKDRNRTGRR